MSATPEDRLRQIDQILQQALDLGADQRESFLNQACGEDHELRAEVVDLLAHALTEDPLLRSGGAVDFDLIEHVPDHDSENPQAIGQTFGNYRIVGLLGKGGMGVVYLAERADGTYRQRVAIKTLHLGAGTQAMARFRRERQLLANLQHRHIARLLDGGVTTTGKPFLVVEHIEGTPIDRYCRASSVSLRETIELLCQVCEAVDAAHRQLIVHRDIKPSNILVTAEGEVKLLDFGIAKLLASEGADTTLLTEQPLMTLQYASPEQYRGETINVASDVYQLGLLAFELLAGRHPYSLSGITPVEAERRITARDPEPPSATAEHSGVTSPFRARDLLGDLDTIVMKALRKEPEQRYGSARELRRDLESYLNDLPVSARPATLRYRLGKLLRRHATAALVATTLLLLLTGLTAAFIHRLQVESDRTQREADQAQRERATAEQAKAEAEEVTDFLIELFGGPDPNLTQGKPLTALDLLARGDARLDEDLVERPRVRARLITAIGRVYMLMGLYEPAVEKLTESLALVESEAADDAESIIDALDLLGQSLINQGREQEAIPLFERALKLIEIQPDSESYDKGHLLVGLASTLQDAGDHVRAEQFARQAVDLASQRYGPTSREVEYPLGTYSNILQSLGRYQEAGDALRRALDIRRRIYGLDTPKRATGLVNLAALYGELGKPELAVPLLEEALRVYQQAFGGSHAAVGVINLNLCTARLELGELETAERHCNQAVAIADAGQHARRTARSYVTLGGVKLRQGALAEAVELRRRAVSVIEANYPPGHELVAESFNALGEALHHIGRHTEAEDYLKRSEQIYIEALGEQHLHVSEPVFNLAKLYHARGEHAAAEAHYRRALEIRQATLPDGSRIRREARETYAAFLEEQGRKAEAQALGSQARSRSTSLPRARRSQALARSQSR